MAFLPNIPQPTDQLSASQAQILNNFGILGAIAGNTNPSSTSINATSGFNWLYLPPQGAMPPAGAAFTAGNIGFYSANATITGINELFLNKTNQATVVQVPATASILSTNSAPAVNSQGWSYLPSGIFLKWGSFAVATGSFTVTIGAPTFPTSIITVLLTPFKVGAGDQDIAVRLVSVNGPNQFTVWVSPRTSVGSATGGFTYLAIGY